MFWGKHKRDAKEWRDFARDLFAKHEKQHQDLLGCVVQLKELHTKVNHLVSERNNMLSIIEASAKRDEAGPAAVYLKEMTEYYVH